jgi:hypothetical protein
MGLRALGWTPRYPENAESPGNESPVDIANIGVGV